MIFNYVSSIRDPLTQIAQEAVPSSFIPHGRVIDETQSSDDDDEDDDGDDDGDDDSNDDGDDDAIDDDSVDDDIQAAVPESVQHPSQGLVPQAIDPKTSQQARKSDECGEVLEDSARKSRVTVESEDARAFDRAQRDYHFSRLLSWEAALREREDRLLAHCSSSSSSSSTLGDRSRRSSMPFEVEKASGPADSPLSPHIHIHNHLPSPPPITSASVDLRDPKPTVVLDDSYHVCDGLVAPSQITDRTSDDKHVTVAMRPSATPSLRHQQSNRDSCKDSVLHSSIDLSGLSLEVDMSSAVTLSPVYLPLTPLSLYSIILFRDCAS